MSWEEARHALGVADMDATHREFVALLDGLAAASDRELPSLLAQLQEHTRRHFEHEGRLMQACRFPATGEHHGEHLRILGELAHVARRAAAGRPDIARSYLKGLPAWFSAHLATMDSALAACLKAGNVPPP